jgi:predicted ester cyclase
MPSDETSLEENQRLIEYYTDQVWTQGHLEVVNQLVAADYRVHIGETTLVERIEEHKQAVAVTRAAFPDMRFTVEDAIAQGDKVVARIVGRGTHLGPYSHPVFGELAPTGRAIVVHEICIYRIAGGKLVDCWPQFDRLGLLQQLGALPAAQD